jgi:hypothetical protein
LLNGGLRRWDDPPDADEVEVSEQIGLRSDREFLGVLLGVRIEDDEVVTIGGFGFSYCYCRWNFIVSGTKKILLLLLFSISLYLPRALILF